MWCGAIPALVHAAIWECLALVIHVQVILGTVLTIQLTLDLVRNYIILTTVCHGLLVDALAQVLLMVGNSAMMVIGVVYDGVGFLTHLWTVHLP